MKIGDFSRFTQVTIKTLRYYDKIGLFSPAFVDPFTGYRQYQTNQAQTLYTILSYKELGFSLEQIQTIIANKEEQVTLQKMLEQRELELENELQRLSEKLQAIRRQQQRFRKEEAMNTTMLTKEIPEQRVLGLRDTVSTHPDQETLWDELTYILAEQDFEAKSPSITLYHDQGHKESQVDLEVIVPLHKQVSLPKDERLQIRTLPKQTMACMLHHGPFSNLHKTFQALYTQLEQSSWQKVGKPREVYLQCPPKDDKSKQVFRQFHCDRELDILVEVQFPIKPRE